jgi:hypothetical protein
MAHAAGRFRQNGMADSDSRARVMLRTGRPAVQRHSEGVKREVHFVCGPKVHLVISHQSLEFFPTSAVRDPPEQ